jgi:hypothetical protein
MAEAGEKNRRIKIIGWRLGDVVISQGSVEESVSRIGRWLLRFSIGKEFARAHANRKEYKMNYHSESDRVRENTAPQILERIDAQIEANIESYKSWPRSQLDQRIRELEQEWDIERVLETNASALALTGLCLGASLNRKWLLLTGTVLGFLMQHALQGWCPPVPVFRRLGVRTKGEIHHEISALRALRGDFDHWKSEAQVRRQSQDPSYATAPPP